VWPIIESPGHFFCTAEVVISLRFMLIDRVHCPNRVPNGTASALLSFGESLTPHG
jgi:hypothetical protein